MRAWVLVMMASVASSSAMAQETRVELEVGVALASVWHSTQDYVFAGLSEEADYQQPGPALGLRLAQDTSRPWMSVAVGLRGSTMQPTTTWLSGTTTVTVDPEEPGVDIQHAHQTELMLQYAAVDATAFFHGDPGVFRLGVEVGPGVRFLDVQRETVDVFFLPGTEERTERSFSSLRAQAYLALALRGSVEVADGVRLGLTAGLDPGPSDLRLWKDRHLIRDTETGAVSTDWETRADMSWAMPRAALVLGVAL